MKTPIYLFSKDKIAANYRRVKQLLPACDIHYALKANSEIEILSVLKDIDAKFDVASSGEFLKLVQIGVSPENIICTLPVKSEEMINTLYQGGCRYFVFDHVKELVKLDNLAGEAKKVLRIQTGDMIANNIEYGMTIAEFHRLKADSPRLFAKIDGVTFFIRNENNSKSADNLKNILGVLERCDLFLAQLVNNKQLILNIGGNYRLKKLMDESYYAGLNRELERMRQKYGLRLLAEPGRAVIESAGVLLTTAVMIKERGDYHDVFIDAGDPTGVITRPGSVRKWGEGEETKMVAKRVIYRFVATTCSHRILFTYAAKFEIQPGDILSLEDYGAYSVCYSSNFHAWDRAAVLTRD